MIKVLEESNNVVIKQEDQVYSFILKNPVGADSGFYLIEAANDADLVEKEFEIIIEGKNITISNNNESSNFFLPK